MPFNSTIVIPNEVHLNILSALDRNEVEKCQLVCQKWKNLVNIRIDSMPYRKFHLLKLGIIVEGYRGPNDVLYAEVLEKEG